MVEGTFTTVDYKIILIFQSIYNTFARPAGDTETIIRWKSG